MFGLEAGLQRASSGQSYSAKSEEQGYVPAMRACRGEQWVNRAWIEHVTPYYRGRSTCINDFIRIADRKLIKGASFEPDCWIAKQYPGAAYVKV